jgi:prevent-host-death family protein
MSTLDIHDPMATFAEVVERVRRGEEITIADQGKPLAMVVPVKNGEGSRKRVRGMWKGKVWMADDFTAPLPEDELREWEK